MYYKLLWLKVFDYWIDFMEILKKWILLKVKVDYLDLIYSFFKIFIFISAFSNKEMGKES